LESERHSDLLDPVLHLPVAHAADVDVVARVHVAHVVAVLGRARPADDGAAADELALLGGHVHGQGR